MSPIKVTEDQKKNLCKFGQGSKTCSFLIMSAEGFCCAKGTDFQAMLEERRFLETIRAMGDNCSGPPEFTANEES
jgi:hypothetical protein